MIKMNKTEKQEFINAFNSAYNTFKKELETWGRDESTPFYLIGMLNYVVNASLEKRDYRKGLIKAKAVQLAYEAITNEYFKALKFYQTL